MLLDLELRAATEEHRHGSTRSKGVAANVGFFVALGEEADGGSGSFDSRIDVGLVDVPLGGRSVGLLARDEIVKYVVLGGAAG